MVEEKKVYQSYHLDLISGKARETLELSSSKLQASLAHVTPAENLSSVSTVMLLIQNFYPKKGASNRLQLRLNDCTKTIFKLESDTN